MDSPGALIQENTALRERIAKLNAAILRINASLDLETVLNEVVDSARQLTGARYGMIATVDEAGGIETFIALGLSADEHRHIAEWPHGYQFFDHLRDLPKALRLGDVPAYLRSLGYTEELTLSKTMQATPMRHRGVYVGSFFLGEKAGGQAFTPEDEEMLVLFASQAATAIANACTHRAERQVRADLEALVDTSPVGVVVFGGRNGRPVSFNREARRIVGALFDRGTPPEEMLQAVTCRRADGREARLDELRDAETVRAEEVELSVPGGRSLTTLVNATPIVAPDGARRAVVVTLQDLAALEEVDRLRAEFLGMVSHELRAPLTSIKGSAATLLETSADLDRAEMREFFRIIAEQADHMRGLIGDLLDVGRIDAGTISVSPESATVAALVERARNTFLSGGGRHSVLIDLPPELPRVMADRRRIVQVLNNLFANAATHAPESSPIRVSAEHDGIHVAITVSDQGRGVAPEQMPRLFRKHASQAGGGLGAAGLGLAICKGLVEAHGGRIRVASGGLGLGTQVTFTLPAVGAAEEDDASGQVLGRPAPRSGPEQVPVLVLDDDPMTLRFVRDALAGSKYLPVVTGAPEELPGLIRSERPQLVLLDLMLPETDGIELMERIPELSDLPVIFISGYGRDETIARALEAGAVDYIVKPFSPTELTARIRAALRGRADPESYRLGDLEIHYEERRVAVAGRNVQLTATEYELLRTLTRDSGRVYSHETLLRRVWGHGHYGDVELVRTFVKKLRRKLGDNAAHPAYIVNERGVGYRMVRRDEVC